jgi:hypothetical protein
MPGVQPAITAAAAGGLGDNRASGIKKSSQVGMTRGAMEETQQMAIPHERMRTTLVSPSYTVPPLIGQRKPRRRRKRSVTLIVLHCRDHLPLSADSFPTAPTALNS